MTIDIYHPFGIHQRGRRKAEHANNALSFVVCMHVLNN